MRHTGLNIPHKRNVMFCTSYLCVSTSRVRLMPIEMEYDIFAHTDNESASVISEREREGGRAMVVSADWFIYFAAYFLGALVPLDAANATKQSQRISVQLPVKSPRFHGSRTPPAVTRFFAKCTPRPCFWSALCAGSFLLVSFLWSCHPPTCLPFFESKNYIRTQKRHHCFLLFHIHSTRSHL